jgi:D-aminoacyl-tRNA deacylase
MRVVIQRTTRAEVRIAGQVRGRIGNGLVLLVGFKADDTEATLEWMAEKIVGLRIFRDAEDKMNRSLEEVGGEVLVVSQFTLYGDARKGRRPSFIDAAHPDIAIPLYERFIALLRAQVAGPVETGEFGAMMEVELVNDGPVTLLLER